jgi:hypothetical protein
MNPSRAAVFTLFNISFYLPKLLKLKKPCVKSALLTQGLDIFFGEPNCHSAIVLTTSPNPKFIFGLSTPLALSRISEANFFVKITENTKLLEEA